jgi:hypothetical protein
VGPLGVGAGWVWNDVICWMAVVAETLTTGLCLVNDGKDGYATQEPVISPWSLGDARAEFCLKCGVFLSCLLSVFVMRVPSLASYVACVLSCHLSCCQFQATERLERVCRARKPRKIRYHTTR